MPLRLLDGFRGTLQTDGYAGYNRVCRENGLTRIGCWDHARRKFVEASKAAPVKKKGTKVSKANGLEPFAYLHHVLQHIGGANTVEDIEALLPWNANLKGKQEG